MLPQNRIIKIFLALICCNVFVVTAGDHKEKPRLVRKDGRPNTPTTPALIAPASISGNEDSLFAALARFSDSQVALAVTQAMRIVELQSTVACLHSRLEELDARETRHYAETKAGIRAVTRSNVRSGGLEITVSDIAQDELQASDGISSIRHEQERPATQRLAVTETDRHGVRHAALPSGRHKMVRRHGDNCPGCH